MSPIRSLDLDRLPEIREALTVWLERVRTKFELSQAYLYGSFARGNPHEGSDIDLVLIGNFAGKLPYRILSVLETTDLPIQPLCYTAEEWDSMVRSQNPLALEVLRTGSAVLKT